MAKRANTAAEAAPARATVLTKALLRAGVHLGVTQAALAEIIGVSPATVSRMAAGSYRLDPRKKEWELAALFVRLFRSLDSIVGADERTAKAWLGSENRGLNGIPADLIRRAEGLIRVVHYLDAARGRI
ncbi:MAG: XRE family transcriptional regulator [Betaproteobacteria bacterium]|nr:XRE family transcriptional regulator [Betaproteobacteria bacterium]